MTEQDKPRFLQAINRLGVAFRVRETIDPVLVQVYFDTLADWSISAVEDAGAELQKSGGSFFPTASVWYEEAEGFARQEQETARHLEQQRASLAWRLRQLPPDPTEQARLEAAHAELLAKIEEVKAKFLARGIPPSAPSGLIHDLARGRRR